MNSLLLASKEKENAEMHVDTYSCFCCKKLFNTHRALRSHLRVHREEIKSRRSFSNSTNNTSPLTNRQPKNSSGEMSKVLPLFNGETSPMAFSKRIYSHESGLVNAAVFLGDNLPDTKSLSLMSSDLSSSSRSAEIHDSNHLFSTENGLSNITELSLNSFALPGTILFPSDPSLCLGTIVCQFNAYEHQTLINVSAFSFEDWNLQAHDLNKFPYPDFAIADPFHVLGSNQLPGFKDSGIGSFPRAPCPCLGQDDGQLSQRIALTCEENKRPYFGDVPGDANMMNASKRSKVNSHPPVQTERRGQKELLLFKDVEPSSSRLGIFLDAEEESQGNLDISLHL